MSIIYDALKKTEKTINSPVNNTGGDRDPEVEAALKKKRLLDKITQVILYVLVIGVGLYIGNLFFDILGKSKAFFKSPAKPLPFAKKQAGALLQQPSLAAKPKEASILGKTPLISSAIKKEPKQPFVLNGVFFSQDEGFALINNRVVKVGDEVGGATVRKIDLEKVELEFEGTKITLSAK